jgi:hypothetical protein
VFQVRVAVLIGTCRGPTALSKRLGRSPVVKESCVRWYDKQINQAVVAMATIINPVFGSRKSDALAGMIEVRGTLAQP